MARAKKARRAKRRPERVRAPAEPLRDQDANAASGALLEEGRGAADVQPEGDASVEDPLQDWPEAEGDPERWLEERSGPDVEKVPDE